MSDLLHVTFIIICQAKRLIAEAQQRLVPCASILTGSRVTLIGANAVKDPTLQNHLHRLRQVLDPHHRTGFFSIPERKHD